MIQIRLDEKPTSISIRYNGYYKLVVLLSIIRYCGRGDKASLTLIHLVFWSLRKDENYQVLYDVAKANRYNLIPWTFEHGIETTLSLGYANGYVEKVIAGDSLKVQITEKGIEVIKSINDFELFTEEIHKIINLGVIPENRLNKANNKWILS
jgi:hypothetical protein